MTEHYRTRIAAERQRQIDVEGYTFEHDTKPYSIGGLLFAAGALANAAEFLDRNPGREHALDNPPAGWPWPLRFWKLDSPERMREKAGALALAAIDAMAGGPDVVTTEEEAAALPHETVVRGANGYVYERFAGSTLGWYSPAMDQSTYLAGSDLPATVLYRGTAS